MTQEEEKRQPHRLYLSAAARGTYRLSESGERIIEIRQDGRVERLGLTYWGVEGLPLEPGDSISVAGYLSCPGELLEEPILMIGGKVRMEE